ncbi:MAG TPA: hypothetical protein VGX23_36125 [Actinocrinis sp.]|nr:hypothetical protein [Actinocrinis sp.]
MTTHPAEGLAATLAIGLAAVLGEPAVAESCAPALHAPSRTSNVAAPTDPTNGAIAIPASFIGAFLPLVAGRCPGRPTPATPTEHTDASGTGIRALDFA